MADGDQVPPMLYRHTSVKSVAKEQSPGHCCGTTISPKQRKFRSGLVGFPASLDGHVAIEPVHDTPVCDDLCGASSTSADDQEDGHDDDCEDDHGCFDLQLGDLASPLEAGRATDDGSSVALAAAGRS